MAECSRIKSLSVSRISLSGLPSQVFTNALEHLKKLELINCNISLPYLSSLMLRLSGENISMKELNLTNTEIGELNPTLLAECSSRLEKICLSNVTEKQTLKIFTVLSQSKSSRLKCMTLEGIQDYDVWYDEGGCISDAVTKLEKFSITFKRYQESTRERAISIPPFMKFLFLERGLDEISIFNKNISQLCHPGNSTRDLRYSTRNSALHASFFLRKNYFKLRTFCCFYFPSEIPQPRQNRIVNSAVDGNI